MDPTPTGSGPVTLRTINSMVRQGRRFACLTCYDAVTARWLARAGLPVILVGDTAGEMVLGHDHTIFADMDLMIALTAAVRRGAPEVLLMGDMPFMSYQASDAEAMHNAARFLTQGRADLVKLEADASLAPLIRRMSAAGIPVVAHVGSRPQLTKRAGGYRAAGRTRAEADRILDDAAALEDAGAVMLLVEAVPAEVAADIVARSALPVIGCGAGPACHGQVIVLHDLLGLTDWQPKFAQPVTNLGRQIQDAAAEWMRKVDAADLGEHPYHMVEESTPADPQQASLRLGINPQIPRTAGGGSR